MLRLCRGTYYRKSTARDQGPLRKRLRERADWSKVYHERAGIVVVMSGDNSAPAKRIE